MTGETDNYGELIAYSPTHWQPLPAPPSAPGDEAPAPVPADAELVEALKTAEAWLARWAVHVGPCAEGELCTCGLTRVRFELEAAMLAARDAGSA